MAPLPLTEDQLLRQVVDLAAILGWQTVHFRPAKTAHGWRTPVQGSMGKGWVDLTLAHEHQRRLIFAELKTEKGRLTAEQTEVLRILGATGAEVYVWRDGEQERIAAILQGDER